MSHSTSQSTNPSILITGATGQVGSALVSLFPDAHTPTRAQLDLADESSIRTWLRHHKPCWIINPAAYTAVDKAESEPALAHAINADAPRILGEEAARLNAAVLHFSTDYVFDGTKASPYTELDPTNPLSVYGHTKLAGEQALAGTGAPHIILRTSWVYGATGKNFLLTILRLARERSQLRIVDDQHGAPTWSRDLAILAAHIVRNYQPEALRPLSGLYHATAAGETSWHGFAREALTLTAATTDLIPIPSTDYPTPAARPLNSRLDCTHLARTFDFRFPAWQASLAKVLAELDSAT